MKILIVVDVMFWAIGSLSKIIQKKNPHLDIEIIAIHPKDLRNNPEVWKGIFSEKVKQFKPDLVHFQYWDFVPALSPLCGSAKKILTHHNQKNLKTHDWRAVDHIVVHTKKAKKELEDAGYTNVSMIQHGIDIEHFRYKENYDETNRVLGYCGRIVPWKGLVDILRVAKELDTKVVIMGKIDKPDYWDQCLVYKDQIIEKFNTPAEAQPSVYHEMAIYVGNSCDNLEEGTLGLLEAMSCGVPVVTTASGEAKDIIKDGENGLIAEFENYDSLLSRVRTMLEDVELRKKCREEAWGTVRILNEERMAWLYAKLYYKIAFPRDLVSVIIPTYNRQNQLSAMLEAYKAQTYRPLEIIVCDDNSQDDTRGAVFDFKVENPDIVLKYVNTNFDGYGLAMARNRGIMEAQGHYLVFNDDRLTPEPTAVEALIKRLSGIKEKSAVWGDKGAGQRSFIENFFAVRKKHLVRVGMFQEAIKTYGGQSQEIRQRLIDQGFKLEFEPMAKSVPAFKTSKAKRRYEIFNTKVQLWKLDN